MPPVDEQARTCSQCCASKLADEFPARGRICLECRRANGRDHYRRNRAYYVAKAHERNTRTRDLVRRWLLDYLRGSACVDCGNADLRVLEFDHRDPSSKRSEVSVLASDGYSLATVMLEVEKCDVRCANCHAIRTRSREGWWREEGWRARHDSNVQPFDP